MSEQENNPETKFGLQRIYVKDFSFESPKAPQSFRQEWKPKINMELNTRHAQVDDQHYEVTLVVTVTAKNDADEVLYLIEIQQAGIFMIAGMTEEVLSRTLGSYCPGVLFPYAREAVDSMVLKGSFPPLMLSPVNFEALYQEALKQRQDQTVN